MTLVCSHKNQSFLESFSFAILGFFNAIKTKVLLKYLSNLVNYICTLNSVVIGVFNQIKYNVNFIQFKFHNILIIPILTYNSTSIG